MYNVHPISYRMTVRQPRPSPLVWPSQFAATCLNLDPFFSQMRHGIIDNTRSNGHALGSIDQCFLYHYTRYHDSCTRVLVANVGV